MQYKITAHQKQWQDELREFGCVITRDPYPEIQHISGASTKQNRLWIGQYATLPLCYYYHRDPQCKVNVTDHKRLFEEMFGNQWDILLFVINEIRAAGGIVPPDDVCMAINQLAPGGDITIG